MSGPHTYLSIPQTLAASHKAQLFIERQQIGALHVRGALHAVRWAVRPATFPQQVVAGRITLSACFQQTQRFQKPVFSSAQGSSPKARGITSQRATLRQSLSPSPPPLPPPPKVQPRSQLSYAGSAQHTAATPPGQVMSSCSESHSRQRGQMSKWQLTAELESHVVKPS